MPGQKEGGLIFSRDRIVVEESPELRTAAVYDLCD